VTSHSVAGRARSWHYPVVKLFMCSGFQLDSVPYSVELSSCYNKCDHLLHFCMERLLEGGGRMRERKGRHAAADDHNDVVLINFGRVRDMVTLMRGGTWCDGEVQCRTMASPYIAVGSLSNPKHRMTS
jgi:hypothetical protein